MNRNGWLKHGNPPGDLSQVARCGAKNRKGTPCQCPAMKNGRCRLHGGLSTGPRTPEGIERIRQARTKHGRYTAAAKEQRQRARAEIQKLKATRVRARQEFRALKVALKARGLL
jgi:hypothetical protein